MKEDRVEVQGNGQIGMEDREFLARSASAD
jgi:hypothetical protein